MKRLLSIFFLLTFLFTFPWPAAAETGENQAKELTAREILDEAKDKQFPDNSITSIRMVLINKNGQKRVREILTTRKTNPEGESSALAVFKSPEDVKGTKFLIVEHKGQPNKTHIYLPSLKKVRRIAGEQRNSSFMGSDFTYADMESSEVEDGEHKLTGSDEVDGLQCHVIETLPRNPDDFQYSKVIWWIEKQLLIPQRIEFYDKKGALLKHLTVQEKKDFDGVWLLTRFTMENVQKNHKTIIEMGEIDFDTDIPDSKFTKRNLMR
ncbi:outer membrane lipoprotein-sorting protein [Thermodesulfobacteriota bacterium]